MGFCFSLSFTIHGLSELPMYKSYPQQQQQPGSMVDLRAYTAEKKQKYQQNSKKSLHWQHNSKNSIKDLAHHTCLVLIKHSTLLCCT